MTNLLSVKFKTLLLALVSLTLLIMGVLNFQQQKHYFLPDDGASWLDSPSGLRAWTVSPGGPADKAGIRPGDLLQSVDSKPVKRAADVARVVFEAGVWSQLSYDLVRNGSAFETELVVIPQSHSNPLRIYLEILGVLYFGIGTFVLLRRWRAPKSLHFYLFCLSSFVLYTCHYTGKLNSFDTAIYLLNLIATVLTPALFLHFCIRFPEADDSLVQLRGRLALVYTSAGVLFLIDLLAFAEILVPPLAARWLIDRLDYFYFGCCFVTGAWILYRTSRTVQAQLVRLQLKLLSRGTLAAILPFALFYAIPYALGAVPNTWMKFSVFSLIFLPVTFAYAILHYRLLDVDVIFRRGIAYTLATASIVGLYFGLIAIVADVFRKHVPLNSHFAWIVAIVITAFLFQPVLNWIQTRLERLFNPEKYNYRSTLLDFARELTSEVRVDRLLNEVAKRVAETLDVQRVAVFLASESGEFELAKWLDSRVPAPPARSVDLCFLNTTEAGYLFFERLRGRPDLTQTVQRTLELLGLHYYLPFRLKERTFGFLGLGKTREGDFLSSEDIDLLQTIAGYVSIALENARLYQSLEREALQYQALKDFNENIIESISAGVIACDLDFVVEAWNSGMERLYGIERSQAVGKRLNEILAPELLAELPGDASAASSLYKIRMETADGRQLIVDIGVTPFRGKEQEVLGRLLIFNDLTERVNLEEQLSQAEKLSSIGLLAAGVAHEVNTPLAVISSQAQMLIRQLPLDESHKPTLERIVKASFRASEIVNSLLKFSRVSGSEYADLDMNKVIRETLSLVDPMLRTSRISLNLQLTSALPLVYGNHGKLQQVFMNLVVNARDAMPHGGELTVASESENSTVHVEVTDNGVGIAPEHLSKIFDPFFTTKTSRGTGLGLAVTYGLMREHSGKIRVESTPGRGTTFHLDFPAARKAVNV
jgi:PAS domain S-box-containing protein